MRLRRCLSGIVLLAVQPLTPAFAQSAADSASLQKFYGEWMGAAMQGFAAYARYYVADGWILPPNATPVSGRDAIARWMENASATSPYVTSPKGIKIDEIRFLGGGLVVYRSTKAEFGAAVREYLSQKQYTPAEIGGRKVRQVLQIPFNFTISP